MLTTHAENIIACYESGTIAQIRTGATWYDDAHALALSLSPGNVWRGAGVIAALSPITPWERNVFLAEYTFANNGISSGTLGQSCRNANRIFAGEHPLDVLNGDKVRAFCSAIADPHHSTIATIDRHAHDIAMGRVFSDKERGKITKKQYRAFSEAYSIAAGILGFSVAQTQAITWVIWKDSKNRSK